ncbi:MAG TPA: NAD(P)/FAD-dependent oxidoreductase [Bryobacterales bacterium]|nr:NAD(P)/FAD-dependent oxidoreductase [Bryobacterales bacterium]
MRTRYDVIIVGGGHNGLVCGSYLARAGLSVLVLERRPLVGGAAVSEETVPGFTFSTFSYVMSLLHPKIIRELELPRFGLEVLPASDLFCPVDEQAFVVLSEDVKRTSESFARFSKRDAEVYPEFARWLEESAALVRRFLFETPPDVARRDLRGLARTLGFLWRHRDLGRDLYRLLDLFTMSAADLLDRWFESPVIKAVFAYYASIGTFAGPRSPGSAYVILHHVMGEHEGAAGWGFVRGGMGAISRAIAESGKRFGLEIATGATVSRIHIRSGRAVGVVLEDGREIAADMVAANVHAKSLYERLVGAEHLPGEVVTAIRNFRTTSTAFKINVACEAPPSYPAFDAARAGFDYPAYVHIGPDLDWLERAFDEAKYGRFSSRPFITPVVPTVRDDSIAPPGKHVVHLFGGHAPYELRNARWEEERDRFAKTVLETLDLFAPGFSSRIIDMQVLTPPDIEHILDLPGGHIFHGELAPDQLFFKRPIPGYADYRTPIRGLYLCGSSAHPGGGVSGIPGHNAAREMLRDRRAGRWRRFSP